ncbi:unnamed protein product [Acanthoscelides obtectus]|uniref:Uncharacterized protein n=1 Tax=Acanthoscelides obtectus TaxID=200917 RepID=A0A9P0JZP8_ACAOB|nr:unnamed protein product [Acanthoscelides obtectus]CAK1628792.1 hypothetical protein AOBTE_LOCUS5404 [Acanthoscelides obtectus]
MRVLLTFLLLCVVQVRPQIWEYPQKILDTWLRRAKSDGAHYTTFSTSSFTKTTLPSTESTTLYDSTKPNNLTTAATTTIDINSTSTPGVFAKKSTLISDGSTVFEASTTEEFTTNDSVETTEESRDSSRTHEIYLPKKEKPLIKISSNISQNLLPLPAGASAALVKPTKYHYYPHNQHIYLLPECAIQQVCNAVYVRLNWTQPLCACPSRYRDPCSASLNSDDQHTTELTIDRKSKKALTLVKTCEPTNDMRICKSPRDWSLLALQNIRTGKSHYLVICRCHHDTSVLEGPMSHDQPTYASVPGIRVYGMMCVDNNLNLRSSRSSKYFQTPPFPWHKAQQLMNISMWD